jgi:hypothetical protein
LAELYLVAAVSFREALGEFLSGLGLSDAEQHRIAELIGSQTARRIHGLAR